MIDPKDAAPGPSGVGVEIVMKGRHGLEAQTEVLWWPEGWRIPQVGESVQIRKDFGGFVEYVDWDIARGLARVVLR